MVKAIPTGMKELVILITTIIVVALISIMLIALVVMPEK